MKRCLEILQLLKTCKFTGLFFLQFFDILRQNGCYKISKSPPVFGIVRFFKMNNFRLKLGFLKHALSDFCFLKTGVFSMRLFSNMFSSKPPPSQILLETKRFASIKDSSGFSGLCDLQETFIKNFFRKFRKNFFLNFLFFERFSVENMGFLLFPVREKWFSSLMRIPRGIFWRCKIDEILTILSFYPWFSLQKFASVSKARLRLCVDS